MGNRSDIPEILSSLFDIFIFPSILEGLGLAAVEAQMAGLNVVASEFIPKEADCGRMKFIQLDSSKWAQYILDIDLVSDHEKPLNTSRFLIENNIKVLSEIYTSY